MDLTNVSSVLVLAPHTDDGELGCGGTISLLSELGVKVHYAAFSNAHESLPIGFPKDTLIKELKQATLELGIKEDDLFLFDFPVRIFTSYRQEILQKMVDMRKKINPDLIFCPSLNDVHQDHNVIAHEALRCFKKQSLLCYEEPWNNISFTTNCFVQLEHKHIIRKVRAIKCYKSQESRHYMNDDFVKSLAITRGSQLNGGYAEAFEIVRLVL
jgi:N-acetylglucosamine malate deacetylase 1